MGPAQSELQPEEQELCRYCVVESIRAGTVTAVPLLLELHPVGTELMPSKVQVQAAATGVEVGVAVGPPGVLVGVPVDVMVGLFVIVGELVTVGVFVMVEVKRAVEVAVEVGGKVGEATLRHPSAIQVENTAEAVKKIAEKIQRFIPCLYPNVIYFTLGEIISLFILEKG
jgi:hypothetical protein